jgi:hypothetical protein
MTKLDNEGNILLDKTPCAGVRADLKKCLLASDCVTKVILQVHIKITILIR